MNPLRGSLERLRQADLPLGTMELAQYLIGKTLVHELPTARLSGVIVETEGYPPWRRRSQKQTFLSGTHRRAGY